MSRRVAKLKMLCIMKGGAMAEGQRIQAFRPEHVGFKVKNITSGQICRLPFGVLNTRIPAGIFSRIKNHPMMLRGQRVPRAGPLKAGRGNRGFSAELFVLALSGRTIVSLRSSIRLNQHSEPEPDIVLFKPRADYYVRSHVTAENCFLVVEIADSSLRYDTR